MTSSDRDPNAPIAGPDGWPGVGDGAPKDALTEPSEAEEDGRVADPRDDRDSAANADAPSGELAPAAGIGSAVDATPHAGADPAATPVTSPHGGAGQPTSWLASAEGLMPHADTSRALPPAYGVPARSFPIATASPAAAAGPAEVQPAWPTSARGSRAPLVPDHWAQPVERRPGFPLGRLVMAFVLGLLLAGFAAAGVLYAYDQQYVGRILPGVRVGAVDLSGLDVATARDRLAEAYASVGQGEVVVAVAGQATAIPYATFDRRVDVDNLAIAAFAVGRAPGPLDRLLGEIRTITRGVTLQPSVLMDAGRLEARVREIARAAESDPVDAMAVVTPDGFSTTASKTGRTVDEGTAAADAAAQLSALDAPARIDVTLAATPIPPSVSDASAQLARSQAALMNNDVTLAVGTETWTIPARTIHGWLSFTVINNRVRIAIDAKAVLAELKPLAEKIDRAPVSATLTLSGSTISFGTPSVDGRTFNASKTTTAVVTALRNRALGTVNVGDTIAPVLAILPPALTTDEARAVTPLMEPISTWTTNYQPSERNGNGANIRIPTAMINGYLVNPGETFSFWKAVGPVTKEQGYTYGGAIIDGRTEPQGAIGGGICSASTTLFNAALRAGFQMGDRRNHFYYINRYPLGLDATVFISESGQAQDMTWINDTAYPVVIRGINGKASVTYKLYSVPNGRTTTFTDPLVKNYTKAHTETRVDKSLPPGTRKQVEYATDGQDTWVTRTVTDSAGAVIHKETYYSHYATITGIILTNS